MNIIIADGLELDTNPKRLPIQEIYEHLITTYWAENRSLEAVQRSIQHSLNYGLYLNNALIGFARVVTDFAVFAYLCDVYILPNYQGLGYGKLLIKQIHEHPELQDIRRWMLATKDAHGLYAQHGYEPLVDSSRWMFKFRTDL